MNQFQFERLGVVELNQRELREIDGGCIWLFFAAIVVLVAACAEAYYDVL